MTLGEATALLRSQGWACACLGGPLCCQHAFRRAEALRRAAHVTVKLMADLENRGGVREVVQS